MPTGKGSKKLWSAEEIQVLIDYVQTHGQKFCAQLLATMGYQRNQGAVGQMARKLDLYYQGPPMGQFRPGHHTHNKGKKMPRLVYEKCAPTMFRKGEMHGAAAQKYSPIGTEKFRPSDQYWWVKVAKGKWALKHRVIWEKHHGPIPPGMLIGFRDGNPHNFAIDNLQMLTRAEYVYNNRWGKGPSAYSLLTGNAAKSRLKRKGITDRQMAAQPELITMAQAETLISLSLRKRRQQHESER